MYHYFCYGLHIASELDMPELTCRAASDDTPDVTVRLASLAPAGPVEGVQVNSATWLGKGLLRLHVRDVARYEVRNGREILFDPAPCADTAALRLYLQGSALGALLMQRGHLVLHGNAIRIGDACMVCIGDSGAGKSTLAAAFLRRGHDILADDVVPVDADGLAIPGFPRIKLWQDAATLLDITTEGLAPIRHGMDKFNLPLERDEQALKRLPIRWIYVLDWHDATELQLEPMQGLARFPPLRRNTYRLSFLHGADMLSNHMVQCTRLAAKVRLARVMRPADKSLSPDETAARLLADMHGDHS